MQPNPSENLGPLADTLTDDAPTAISPPGAVEDDPVLEPGPVLFEWGPLRVLERVGEGSGGEVYRAYDPALQTEVALKLRKAAAGWSDANRKQFLEEARRLARVRHPNVLAIHGADEHDGRMGIWTEFIRGCSLEEYIGRQGPLSACEAAMVGLDLCRALAAVHAKRLIHRDVKTSNVMREQGGRILLMDFGCVAELPASGAVQPDGMNGTPLAMAPEQLRGEPGSARGDVYALGVLLYRLVTCGYPVEAVTIRALLQAHAQGGGIPLRDRRPDLPLEFVGVVERALSADPNGRYPSAGAMEHALSASVSGAVSAAVRPAASRALWRGLALGAGVVVLGFALAASLRTKPATRVPARSPGVESALTPAARPVPLPPLEAKATLYRHNDSRDLRLRPGSPVGPGDGLFLELSAKEPMHTYVLDEDEAGAIYLLFPIPGVAPGNPLPAAVPHRLPGRMGDSLLYWTVTTAGGREGITVIGSRSPLRGLEDVIARVPAAGLGSPVRLGIGAANLGRRSIGGIRKEGAARETHRSLDEAIRALDARRRDAGDVWIWRVQLNDPGLYKRKAKRPDSQPASRHNP